MGHRLPAPTAFLVCVLLLSACGEPLRDADYIASIETWRAEREARLTSPHGWLSLAGLHPLAIGTTQVGSDENADLRLAGGPPLWGEFAFDGENLSFTTGDPTVSVNGEPTAQAALSWRHGETSSEVAADAIVLQLIDRSDHPHVRVRDPNAPSRRDFVGLSWFDVDPSWAIEARFEPHPDGHAMRIADVTGYVSAQPNPGVVTFRRDGETYRLQAVQSSPDSRMWFIFSDGTSGRESYGLGRFLYFDPPENASVQLDFNQAYNPPCAFNPHTTCPLPPPDNRLSLPIRAGEKTYPGPVGVAPGSVALDS